MTSLQFRAPELKYRLAIDGLMVVAVLSAIASHIGVERTRGGFVGVDVFFVISGYLISSIILAHIAAWGSSSRRLEESRRRDTEVQIGNSG